LIIIPEPLPPTITTSCPLPGATVGQHYSVSLQATGGATPYSWSIASGSLPPVSNGSFSSTGTFSGTPTQAGTYNFVLRVEGSDGLASTKSCSITVSGLPDLEVTTLSLTPSSPQAGATLYLYVEIKNSGSSPTGEYDWRIRRNGVTLNNFTGESSLAPGEEADFTVWLGNNYAAGSYTFCVDLDPAGDIDEVTTSNNSQCASITVSTAVPGTPVLAAARRLTSTSVELEWDHSGSGVTHFDVWARQLGVTGASWQKVGVMASHLRIGTVTGLASNVGYVFEMEACNASGCSSPSNQLAVP